VKISHSFHTAEEGCNVAVVDMDLNNAEKAAQDLQQLGIKSKAFQVRKTFCYSNVFSVFFKML
jgi:hypothetical protein